MTLHKPLLEADSSGQRSNMEGQYAVTTASCLHALLLAGALGCAAGQAGEVLCTTMGSCEQYQGCAVFIAYCMLFVRGAHALGRAEQWGAQRGRGGAGPCMSMGS